MGIDIAGLRAHLASPDSLITDLSGQEDYFHDATQFTAQPLAILKAESTADIVSAVTYCHDHGIAVTPRGAGTGLSGGAVASPHALVISTERLTSLQILPAERIAYCGAGVITKDIESAAAQVGLTYPPDPASWQESTIGGNVAEGAGGLRCKKYGVTKDYVLGLRAVLPDGSLLLSGIYNGYRGLNLGDLLIASEGTLAIVTDIAVRLTPPISAGITILAAFDHPRYAAQTVSDITSAGIIPTVLEFLDGDAAACSNAYEKTEGLDNVAAILLMETGDENKDALASAMENFCHKNHCTVFRKESDPEKVEHLWKVRRNLSKAIKQSAAYRISEDIAVPNSKFPVMVEWVAELNRTSQLRINAFGHAGDGNLHVNFLAPDQRPETMALVESGIEALMRKTIELGGTLTGEHGIGLAKKKYLSLEFDAPTLRLMKSVKLVFDPGNQFNPDKLLGLS